MLKIYTAYKCKGCRRTFILVTQEMLNSMGSINFIACPYCGCKKINPVKEAEDLRDCMTADSHIRHKGAIKQKGWER